MLRSLLIFILFIPQLSASQDRGHFIEKLKDNSDQQVFTRLGIHVDLDKHDSTVVLNNLASIENELSRSSSKIKTRATALKARLLFYKLGPGDSLYAKIQLGTRQISAMQGISADTVHKTKQRLRQRFGTSSTSELEAMLATV
jgi:hypothetical protein